MTNVFISVNSLVYFRHQGFCCSASIFLKVHTSRLLKDFWDVCTVRFSYQLQGIPNRKCNANGAAKMIFMCHHISQWVPCKLPRISCELTLFPGTPRRAQWDRNPPTGRHKWDWANIQFHALPPLVFFAGCSPQNPAVVPGPAATGRSAQ